MIRNFSRINNYYNTKEAWNDWYRLAAEVEREGYRDLLHKYAPVSSSGWRRIDRCIAKLRKEFEETLRIDRFLELVETANSDPAHVAYAEPEDWLCGTNYVAEHEDFLDLKRTENDARF